MLYLTGKDQEIDDYVYDHKALDWIVEAAQVLLKFDVLERLREIQEKEKRFVKN